MAQKKITFGEILREERERQGLSLSDVASTLNLRVSLVRDLENNLLDRKTADVFSRGYVRSYAELLKIDSDGILKIYDDYVGNTASRREKENLEARHYRAQHNKKMAVTAGLIAGLILLLLLLISSFFLWYKYSEPAPLLDDHVPFAEFNEDESIQMTIEESTDPESVSKTREQELEDFDRLQQEIRDNSAENEQTAAGTDAYTPSQSENVASSLIRDENRTSAEESATVPATDWSSRKLSVVVPEPTVDIKGSSAEIEAQRNSSNHSIIEINTSPNYNIHIEFSGDCWLDLKSGMNDRRVTALVYKKDRVLDYNLINMPLKFTIGAPGNISRLIVNDYLVDLSGAVPDKPYHLEVSTK